MFYQWFSFKKQSHLLSNLDSFFLTMVLSRHVLSYRIPWCYRTMSQSYLSPWCYRTMASSYLILFLTHPTFVIVPWNIYHTKIYCKWTSLFDRAYRANLRPEKVIYFINNFMRKLYMVFYQLLISNFNQLQPPKPETFRLSFYGIQGVPKKIWAQLE